MNQPSKKTEPGATRNEATLKENKVDEKEFDRSAAIDDGGEAVLSGQSREQGGCRDPKPKELPGL